MSHYKYDLAQKVYDARQKIKGLFVQQCKHGEQTEELGNNDVAACGQFIGSEAQSLKQRGLHGTAAALKVLATDPSQEATELTQRLVEYIRDRRTYELACRGEGVEAEIGRKCHSDFSNVIKLSEVIAGLTTIQGATTTILDLVTSFSESLKKGFQQDKGWSYFLDDEESPEILPTAYAYNALAALGHDEIVRKAEKNILNHLGQRYSSSGEIHMEGTDIIGDVACLYFLTFSKASNGFSSNKLTILKNTLHAIWKRLESVMEEELEQNVEYWYKKQKTSYVRVPWQLYLIALAARFSWNFRFSSSSAQKKLEYMLAMIKEDKFHYPHSGKMLSSRTHAILFEVLGYLEECLSEKRVFGLALAFDRGRNVLSSKRVKIGISIVAVLLIVYAVVEYMQSPSSPEIVTGIIGALVLWILDWARKTR